MGEKLLRRNVGSNVDMHIISLVWRERMQAERKKILLYTFHGRVESRQNGGGQRYIDDLYFLKPFAVTCSGTSLPRRVDSAGRVLER